MLLYIGIYLFFNFFINENLIYDWCVFIFSMFYDYELGEVYFDVFLGEVKGNICLKC